MHLDEYLKASRGRARDIAMAIGAQAVLISQWASRSRPIPVERCPDIERATNGAVMRWDLRPDDWHRIWPELRARADAPAVDVAEAVTS